MIINEYLEYSLDNPRLKPGDKGYYSVHQWIKKKLGKPSKCDLCKSETAKRYDWANKTGYYKSELDDWLRLCRRCHQSYDGMGPKKSMSHRKRLGLL